MLIRNYQRLRELKIPQGLEALANFVYMLETVCGTDTSTERSEEMIKLLRLLAEDIERGHDLE